MGKWEAGKVSGTYVLSVPATTPQVDLGELSDDDLLAISGGAINISISNCCCTPCCSCA